MPLDGVAPSFYAAAFPETREMLACQTMGLAQGIVAWTAVLRWKDDASMAKKVVGYIKLQIPAGKANPSPPVGPALGQRGLNIMAFVKEFNAVTQGMEPGMPVPVVITAFGDRTFTFVMKTPPNTYFLMKAAKLTKGSPTVGKSSPRSAR